MEFKQKAAFSLNCSGEFKVRCYLAAGVEKAVVVEVLIDDRPCERGSKRVGF